MHLAAAGLAAAVVALAAPTASAECVGLPAEAGDDQLALRRRALTR